MRLGNGSVPRGVLAVAEVVRPRIRERDVPRERHGLAERRSIRIAGVEEHLRRVVEQAIARADGGLAAIAGGEDHTHTWCEVILLTRVVGAARIAGVARKRQAGRSLRVYRTLRAGREARHGEVLRMAVAIPEGNVWLPAQTVVQGQVLVDLPGILRIGADVVVHVVLVVGVALREGRDVAQQEVRIAYGAAAGDRSAERKRTVRRTVVHRIHVGEQVVRAEGDLVIAADDVDVVDELILRGVEVSRVVAALAKRESIGDSDAHEALQVRRHVVGDAKGAGIEERDETSDAQRPVSGQTGGVDDICGDVIGVTDDDRLILVELTHLVDGGDVRSRLSYG